MLVYDITKQSTLDSLDSWMNEIKTFVTNPNQIDKIVFVVFANKSDKSERQHTEQGRLWVQKNGCYYFETSANTGDGVQKAFQMMFKGIVQVLETGSRPKSAGITLGLFLLYFSGHSLQVKLITYPYRAIPFLYVGCCQTVFRWSVVE